MGVQERKAREKEELRKVILDAATDLFSQEGYEAVSMRKIAERIEYSPTTIYLYFKDKTDLLDNVCADTFGGLLQVLAAIESENLEPLEGLSLGLKAYIQFGLDHPAHYRVTFLMRHTVFPARDAPCKADCVGDLAFGALVRSVSRCMEAGILRADDPQLVSETLWSAIHGLTALLITHPEFPWSDKGRLVDHMITTLLEGLRAR
ncbi:MAG: TetR/AcrR family transcriptional regulator [Bryobacteraceae bacterium]|nr:TetR/AcrR family transcriptional regulator [Bryobacteraceae bacterium]